MGNKLWLQFVCSVMACILLSACASVPLMSMPKLMALDPETIELGDIEVAVRVQDSVQIKADGVSLGLTMESKTTADKLRKQFVLQKSDQLLTKFLKKRKKRGTQIVRYKLNDADIEAATKFRQEVLALRQVSGKKTKMHVSAYARFCQKINTPQLSAVHMTIFLRTDPKKKFYTLFKENKMEISGAKGLTYCKPTKTWGAKHAHAQFTPQHQGLDLDRR